MALRKKKISISYFLNDDLNSKGKKGALYRLYARVTFMRKNTKFPLANHWFPKELEEELEDVPELKVIKVIIEKIVRYEYGLKKDKYSISGFGKRFLTYSSHIKQAVEWCFMMMLEQEVSNIMPHSRFLDWSKKPYAEKTREGLIVLGQNASSSLMNIGSVFVLIKEAKINPFIYAWLLNDEREELKKQMLKSSVKPEGFKGKESLDVISEILDNFCLELVRIGYTEHVIVEGASVEIDGSVIKINV